MNSLEQPRNSSDEPNHSSLSNSSREMVEQLTKGALEEILTSHPTPSGALNKAFEEGRLAHIPELLRLKETPQDPHFHPEGDVWIHTMMVVDWAAKIIRDETREFSRQEKLAIMLGALFHDIGKPDTTVEQKGRLRCPGHEEAGGPITSDILSRIGYSPDVIDLVNPIVVLHMKPKALVKLVQTEKISTRNFNLAILRMVKDIKPLSLEAFLAATEADYRGRGFPERDNEDYELREIVKLAAEFDPAPKAKKSQALVSGNDLINTLGMSPSPEFKAILQDVASKNQSGELTTRDEALSYIRRTYVTA